MTTFINMPICKYTIVNNSPIAPAAVLNKMFTLFIVGVPSNTLLLIFLIYLYYVGRDVQYSHYTYIIYILLTF